MELSRFSKEEWQRVRERLLLKEGGYSEETFIAWLSGEDVEARIMEKLGPDWKLEDALTLATGGPKVVRRASKRKKREMGEDESDAAADVGAESITDLQGKVDNLETRIKARVDEYLRDFDNVSVNDRASLTDLANTEIALEEMNRLRVLEMAKEFPNPDTLKRLTESTAVLSTQTRSLQKMLDIDRVKRKAAKQEGDEYDKVMDVIDAAGKFVEDEAIKLMNGNTLLGYLLTDFPEFEHIIRVKMPGHWVEIQYLPDEKALRALEPEWVAVEEAKYQGQVMVMEEE